MTKIIERVSDGLAAPRSRRSFLGLAVKAGAITGGVLLGLVGFEDKAGAWTYACCTFADDSPQCTNCPSCNAGQLIEVVTWTCCDSNHCQWQCKDCTLATERCSCPIFVGGSICGAGCPQLPTRQ